MGASSLASAVGAIARPVEVEVVAEVLTVVRVVAERVVGGMVVPALVVSLSVVPGMVVPGSVVADSTEVSVVLTTMVVVPVVSVAVSVPVSVLVSVPVRLERIEDARLSTLLATDEASEATLEAMALPDARADETAADTDEMRGGTLPLVVACAIVSPDKRPRATRARVWAFMVKRLNALLSLSGANGRRGRRTRSGSRPDKRMA